MTSSKSIDPMHSWEENTISGAMPTHEIMMHLKEHGCIDISHDLDIAECTKYPVATGGFGDVYRGRLRQGDAVAIKCLRVIVGAIDEDGKKELRRAAHEVYVWSKCNHPNVLKLIGLAQYQGRIAMVSPWMERVAYLHANGIIHGDIKGAPEILLEETKLTFEGDIYALGMETMTGLPPYHGSSNEAVVVRKITTGIHPNRPVKCFMNSSEHSDVIWSVFTDCWSFDPLRRPRAEEIAKDGVEEMLICLKYHGCKIVSDKPDLHKYPRTIDLGRRYTLMRNSKVAFKTIISPKFDTSRRDNFQGCDQQSLAHELYVWSKCSHPHILHLVGATQIGDSLAIVSPWIGGGRLPDYISQNKRLNNSCNVVRQMRPADLFGTKIHQDIKMDNILVSDNENVKLCGFENARIYRDDPLKFPGITPDSTESLMLMTYLQGDEISALGMVCHLLLRLSMAMGQNIVVSNRSGHGHTTSSRDLLKNNRLQRPLAYIPMNTQGNLLWNLITRCCQENTWLRPTARKIYEIVATLNDEEIWGSEDRDC
ncbi:Pkinase domain-containing protein [Rhizoctonia solani AG-1 IA]|uniref:Pkinase domain-containing protein n=1 Tax=Thanatephorus cucumeris (strain AG1-IA) TaxID=983506 RepID=L8X4B3_THACA|nr:Pkinase domain-containing protein [Rhizoctonia solani AG-1 IA]